MKLRNSSLIVNLKAANNVKRIKQFCNNLIVMLYAGCANFPDQFTENNRYRLPPEFTSNFNIQSRKTNLCSHKPVKGENDEKTTNQLFT